MGCKPERQQEQRAKAVLKNVSIPYIGIAGTDRAIKQTSSVCQFCYKPIAAIIYEHKGAAYMVKICSEHGEFRAMVELDAQFYAAIESLESKPVYYHQVVDVTHRCNVACPNCYYPVTKARDRSIDSILQEIEVTNLQAVLSGGEPTLRDDLPEIIRRIVKMGRPVSILTNGIRLANEKYLDAVCEAGLLKDGAFHGSVSLHSRDYLTPAHYEAKIKAIEHIVNRNGTLAEVMWTIQSLEEIPAVVKAMRELRGTAEFFRVRSPFSAWAENRSPKKFFVSEIVAGFKKIAQEESVQFALMEEFDNNVYHVTVRFDGMPVRLICCPDKGNIDVGALYGKGPFHRANSGELTNLLHSFIINEGMSEGWLNGRRISPEAKPSREITEAVK